MKFRFWGTNITALAYNIGQRSSGQGVRFKGNSPLIVLVLFCAMRIYRERCATSIYFIRVNTYTYNLFITNMSYLNRQATTKWFY